MEKLFITYLDGGLLKNSTSSHIGNAILELNLREGDIFTYRPFNTFSNEGTDFVGDIESHHNKQITIFSIKTIIVDTWNSSAKLRIEILLKSN